MLSILSITGCFGGGGEQPPVDVRGLVEDIFLVAGVGGGLDVGSGFKSPTVEPPPGEQQAHVAAMVLSKRLAARDPRVMAWVMEPVNFELVATIAQSARCPVCKGLLMAAGCTIHYTRDLTTAGYDQDIWITRPDGSAWGKPPPSITSIQSRPSIRSAPCATS
jgi:hypothetical protein